MAYGHVAYVQRTLLVVAVMITRILVIMTATRSLERGLFAYPVSRISIQCHKMLLAPV